MGEEIKTSIAVVFYNSERECAFQTDFDDPSPNLPRASVIKLSRFRNPDQQMKMARIAAGRM